MASRSASWSARASKRALGSKQRLAVVRCYDRTFALGLGEKEIALIAELDPVVAPADRKPTTRADDHAFQRALEKLRENDVKPAKPKAGERAIAGELFG